MSNSFARLRGQDGATAVEYGIMVALIAVVIISAVYALGSQLNDDYECVEQYVRETPQNAPTPC
ncbi:Flp family type IVb pilin [Nitriliruptor alkaliphilus]|uniref:Flp family type IVb pilin n=1 Tax=Nitriliruptor alkaliphilus TaxID=427918 RepID=UPI0009FA5464|nr:Flp family type IVb pilin [Nitriliruptor alkaliphilus]